MNSDMGSAVQDDGTDTVAYSFLLPKPRLAWLARGNGGRSVAMNQEWPAPKRVKRGGYSLPFRKPAALRTLRAAEPSIAGKESVAEHPPEAVH